jgi:hypothetical protein
MSARDVTRCWARCARVHGAERALLDSIDVPKRKRLRRY